MFRYLTAFCLVINLAACTSSGKIEPTELAQTLYINPPMVEEWRYHNESIASFSKLSAIIDGRKLVSLSADGSLITLNKFSGEELERFDGLQKPASSLAKSMNGYVYVDQNGYLIEIDENANTLAEFNLHALALQSPLVVNQNQFVVQTVDGRLSLVDLKEQKLVWSHETLLPSLTAHNTAKPVFYNDQILTGFGSGTIAAINLQNGQSLWEFRIGQSQGRGELQRIVDADSKILVLGDYGFALSREGVMVVVDLLKGQIVAETQYNGVKDLTTDGKHIYIVGVKGKIFALDSTNLQEKWQQTFLVNRQPTSMVPWQDYLAVADHQGYVHLLDPQSGEPKSRQFVDFRGVDVAPIVVKKSLIVQGNTGHIVKLSLDQ